VFKDHLTDFTPHLGRQPGREILFDLEPARMDSELAFGASLARVNVHRFITLVGREK
jgi:hypothetical protein